VQGVRDDKNLNLFEINLNKGIWLLFFIKLGYYWNSIPLNYLISLTAIDPDKKLPDVLIH
jgi:hypothetical protein